MNPPSDFSQQPACSDNSDLKMEALLQSFEIIANLAESEIRQQKIREASAMFQLSEVSYRKQLKRYLCTKGYQTKAKYQTTDGKSQFNTPVTSWLKPVSLLDTKVSDFVDLLKGLSLIKLSAVLGEAALLFAMVSYIVTIPGREQQQIQKAREILFHKDHKYAESRIAALELLDQKCAGNPGLIAPQAHLVKLAINGCFRWSFDPQSLTQGSLRSWQPMDLSNSMLAEANFSNAVLRGANLSGSDLRNANLQKVDLRGVNLRGANLKGADLSRANLTEADLAGAILDEANLYGVTASQTNFTNTSMVNIKAPWSYFDRANFYRANLQQANFNRSNLKDADFYKVNLTAASLRFTNLRGRTRFFGAQLRGADFWGAQWANIFQIKRGQNWKTTKQTPQWEKKVTLAMVPALRIGLIKPQEPSSLFEAYELGMRRAANRRVDIWGFESEDTIVDEAATIERMIELGMDAIILRPSDPLGSLSALKKASEAGLAIITVDSCLDREVAEDVAVACFDTDSEKMGYDSGVYLDQWAQQNLRSDKTSISQPIQIALVDGAVHERNYPYLQGVMAAIDRSSLSWKTSASVGVDDLNDTQQVMEILKAYPEIQILWGGSNVATKVALKAVEELDIGDRVAVFGILDLSQEQSTRLLDTANPLQSIIDQSGVQTGKQAAERAIAVLRGKVPGEVYEEHVVEHRLLTQEDTEQVQELLDEAGSL
ncbi:MAG: pentapeptide repeat-containing protein [Cyanobacteria bacterium P01_E01_bin.35]